MTLPNRQIDDISNYDWVTGFIMILLQGYYALILSNQPTMRN
jgi:hypothetical protein